MEEKLRNLSQNIAANTGDEHKPKHHDSEEEAPKEEESHEEPHEESQPQENAEELQEKLDEQNEHEEHSEPEEEVSDYTPEPEDQPEEHSKEESDEPLETIKEDSRISGGDHGGEQSVAGASRTALRAERLGDDENQTESSPSKDGSSDSSTAKILTMDEAEEPQESPTRTKKYSPEVEAALNRLNAEDAAVDLSEPLSTEPKKKGHGAQIFLFILFLLAIAAVTLCILVEQKIIDNPFPNIFNKTESSQTTTVDKTTPTDTEIKTETKTETEGGTTEPTRNNTNADIKEQE